MAALALNRRYRHYKGRDYLVLAVATHSETLEKLVVYQALYGERGVWVRPLEMFLETVSWQTVSKYPGLSFWMRIKGGNRNDSGEKQGGRCLHPGRG